MNYAWATLMAVGFLLAGAAALQGGNRSAAAFDWVFALSFPFIVWMMNKRKVKRDEGEVSQGGGEP